MFLWDIISTTTSALLFLYILARLHEMRSMIPRSPAVKGDLARFATRSDVEALIATINALETREPVNLDRLLKDAAKIQATRQKTAIRQLDGTWRQGGLEWSDVITLFAKELNAKARQ